MLKDPWFAGNFEFTVKSVYLVPRGADMHSCDNITVYS